MRTIFKTKLDICYQQTIELPKDSIILHIDKQNGAPCIWYECSSDKPIVGLDIFCFGTGYRMNDAPPMVYIGTVQINGYVWHYYRAECAIVSNVKITSNMDYPL